MGWIYLAVSEESQKPSKDMSNLSLIVKSTDTPWEFCCPEWLQAICPSHLFGTTLPHLGAIVSRHPLTSYTADFPAKTFQSRGAEKAWLESVADFSSRSLDWCVKFDRDSCSWKTYQQSLWGGALGVVIGELSSIGYDCRWETIPTAKKEFEGERWFLLAKAMREGLQGCDVAPWTKMSRINNEKRQSQFIREGGIYIPEDVWTETIRIPDGIPNRLDRVRALGNAVVPAQAREAFERLMGLKGE